MKVVTFGEIMLRLGAPAYLKLIQTNQFDVSYAGAEANVAVSLVNYGIETDLLHVYPIIQLQNAALWTCVVIRSV